MKAVQGIMKVNHGEGQVRKMKPEMARGYIKWA